MRISERINIWREDAAVLRRWGADEVATILERAAADLEEDARRVEGGGGLHLIHSTDAEPPELVELRTAVHLSGYTRGHLRRMIVGGTLTNYGTDTRPLLRAADLPRKPGYSLAGSDGEGAQ